MVVMKLSGIAVSPGIAEGKIYLVEEPKIAVHRVPSDPEIEKKRFDHALDETVSDLEHIRDTAAAQLAHSDIDILDAHVLMVKDPDLIDGVTRLIDEDHCNAEYAVDIVGRMFISSFENMNNEYMRTRAADLKGLLYRILCHLSDVQIPDLSLIREPVILAGKDINVSDALAVDQRYIKGFLTQSGSLTSHVAILARSIDKPALVGIRKLTKYIDQGDTVIIDGIGGQLIIDPEEEEIQLYRDKKAAYTEDKKKLLSLKDAETRTTDDHVVELYANMATQTSMDTIGDSGAEGIGLFRSEFLYLDRDSAPGEDLQYRIYKSILESMPDRRIIIRTLDVGADRFPKYIRRGREANPFLGVRAIRFSLQNQEIFRTQLRALMRASVHGRLSVLLPMIATLDELMEAKQIFAEEKEKLLEMNIPVSDEMELGIMIEVPSAALMAESLAREVDFLSIGTNDLIQFTFAADRMSENVSYLYQPLHPAVLRLIKMIIDGAHAHGRWCGMCGEMAGDLEAVPVLLGLGLDMFSMSETFILSARKLINSLNYMEMTELAEQAVSMSSAKEVQELVREAIMNHNG